MTNDKHAAVLEDLQEAISGASGKASLMARMTLWSDKHGQHTDDAFNAALRALRSQGGVSGDDVQAARDAFECVVDALSRGNYSNTMRANVQAVGAFFNRLEDPAPSIVAQLTAAKARCWDWTHVPDSCDTRGPGGHCNQCIELKAAYADLARLEALKETP